MVYRAIWHIIVLASCKRALPREKFEQLMALAYDDDIPPSIPSEDNDENEVHEEGLN